jgi:uncharacterized protein YjiS (DUF1127 family)
MTSTVHPPTNGAALFDLGSESLLSRLMAAPRRWLARHAARQTLLELDDHLLADIGMTRGNAVIEWQKAFWEA